MPDTPGPGRWTDPGSRDFVVNRWLQPSLYNAVPDPSRPAGRAARQRHLQAQQEAGRLAEISSKLSGPEDRPGPQGEAAYWKAAYADHQAEVSCAEFEKEWIAWQYPQAEAEW